MNIPIDPRLAPFFEAHSDLHPNLQDFMYKEIVEVRTNGMHTASRATHYAYPVKIMGGELYYLSTGLQEVRQVIHCSCGRHFINSYIVYAN